MARLISLTILMWAVAHPTTVVSSAPVSSWSGELVNRDAEPNRELVVSAWYPNVEQDDRLPLILLAPGRGVSSTGYSLIASFLAEHGFVVVSVDSPGSGRQVFPDGRVVPPDPELEPPPGLMAGPYIEVDRFFAEAAAVGAEDLAYVLDRIAVAGSSMIFASRVHVDRVGLIGHSLGGRIAGAFADMDDRAIVWIGIEGLAPRHARRHGLGLPALAILSEGIWPYAIDNVRELAWCAKHPTYFAKIAGIEHNTITNGGSEAVDGMMSPGQVRLAEVILDFLAHHLSSSRLPLQHWPDGVTVETHVAPSVQGPPGQSCND